MILNHVLSLQWIFLHWLCQVFGTFGSKIRHQKASHSSLQGFFFGYKDGIKDSGEHTACTPENVELLNASQTVHWRGAETDHHNTSLNQQLSLCLVHINRQIVVSTAVCKPLHVISACRLVVVVADKNSFSGHQWTAWCALSYIQMSTQRRTEYSALRDAGVQCWAWVLMSINSTVSTMVLFVQVAQGQVNGIGYGSFHVWGFFPQK